MEYERAKCDYLKKLRERIAKINDISGFEYRPCQVEELFCSGTCPLCDKEIKDLTFLLQKKGYKIDSTQFSDILPLFDASMSKLIHSIGFENNQEVEWENNTKIEKLMKKNRREFIKQYSVTGPIMGGIGGPDFPDNQHRLSQIKKRPEAVCKLLNIGKLLGISRHRIHLDGPGVTTLIGMHNCNLDCKYCINSGAKEYAEYTIQELYDEIKLDSLYFEMTGGGLCFGGHEPLLQQDFLKKFIQFVRKKGHTWKIGIETNLNYKLDNELISLLDFMIVDVKSMNPDTYKKYTGKDNNLVVENLKTIKDEIPNILIRIPRIFEFNDETEIQESIKYLKELGYQDNQLDIFTYVKI